MAFYAVRGSEDPPGVDQSSSAKEFGGTFKVPPEHSHPRELVNLSVHTTNNTGTFSNNMGAFLNAALGS